MILTILWLMLLLLAFSVANEDLGRSATLPSISDFRKLQVGQELFSEKLILKGGQCIYTLKGLELLKSYEVKISYPASIPASFTIELLNETPFQGSGGGRRLLNTEKLMFRADESQGQVYDGILLAHVLVTVEPAGVVAMPYAKDHSHVIFNIICEEVIVGIPLQAWWIALLGLIALLISALSPMLLPQHLLQKTAKETRKRRI